MIAPEDLFVMDLTALEEDLFRMGNATSPGFGENRVFSDCTTVNRGGITVVFANGSGFSTFNHVTGAMKAKGKNVWKIKRGSVLPVGLVLAKDLKRPTHFLLAPGTDMPLKKYLGLLEELATNSHVSVKLTPQEILNAH